MAPFSLLPRDERFIGRFQRAAQNLAAGAGELYALMRSPEDVSAAVRRLEELEHVGDQLTHEIFDALNRAFVTPFDREDIAQLAAALDDVIDEAEEAAQRFLAYRLERPTELAIELSRVLVEQCRAIESAVALLDEPRQVDVLRRSLVELHRLENEADELLNRALGSLYTDVTEVPALVRAIQWGDIYAILERATDRAESVAVALETIVVKSG